MVSLKDTGKKLLTARNVIILGAVALLAFAVVRGGQGIFGLLSGIKLPEIKLPMFNFPALGGMPAQGLDERTFTRMELSPTVPLPQNFAPDLQNITVPQLGRADPRRMIEMMMQPTIQMLFPNQPVSISDFINRFANISPADAFRLMKMGLMIDAVKKGIVPPPSGVTESQLGLQKFTQFQTTGFTIKSNRPLSDILRMRPDLTASQAANLKAIINPDPKVMMFDFGTNTGQALQLRNLNFGRGAQLSSQMRRSTPEFQNLLKQEALKAQSTFNRLFPNIMSKF